MAEEAGQGGLLSAERGPWTGGYTSSVPGFMARPDQLIGATDGTDTNSSRDATIDPFTGGISRRTGCAIINDTVSAGIEVTGLLNYAWNAKARKLFAIDSPSLTDGYPTLACLYGNDTNASFPTADSGFRATIWLNSTNPGAVGNNALKNYSLLEEFDSTDTYARTPSITLSKYRMKVVPIWMESGDGVYFRGAPTGTAGTDKFMQQFVCAGSRNIIQTQNWLYSPNLRCTPWRWNKRFNESTTVPAAANYQSVRIYPTGPYPLLYPPTYSTATTGASGTSWSDGDTYFISCIAVREDGSPNAPTIPRSINSVLASGFGLITVGTVGGTNKYASVTYSNIPLGPDGTTRRVLVRSVKQNRTASTDNITVAPLDLRIIGVLNNNTQKIFIDYGGDDNSLVEDDDFVDVDWTVPRRGRYAGTGDSRAIVSYTLPNTAAIMLAPVSINNATTYDLNIADDDTTLPTVSNVCYVRITGAGETRTTAKQLELHCQDGATAVNPATNYKAFLFSTYDTLEKLVDAINATLTTDFCKLWRAQLAPGIDPTMPTESLTCTTLDLAVTGTSSTTLTGSATDIAKIGIGMKLFGTSVTLGTYVVSKASNGTDITISSATTGAPGATTTFYSDTGDTENGTLVVKGMMRAFCPSLPVLLHMKPSAFPDYATPDKASVYFTNASPGAASSGISLAPNSYTAQNRRLPHSSPRQTHGRSCTGIVDIEGAAIIAYSDGIYMFANQRGANTGEDFDCRLFTINDTRGCVSYLGLTAGNGWAAYPTTEGIVVTDKNRREFSISGDIFNPSENIGDLAYEILTSAASVAGDTDDQYLSCGVIGSRLYVGFRESTVSKARIAAYDFSPGVEASGVEELLDPDTKRTYAWGPPAIYNANHNLAYIGAIGSIRNASGRIDYFAYDTNNAPLPGRIEKFNTVTTDNAEAYYAYGFVPPLIANPFMAIQIGRLEVTHRSNQSSGGTASIIAIATDQTPTYDYTILNRTLLVNGVGSVPFKQYTKQAIPIDQGQRGKTDALWAAWRSNAVPVGSVLDRIWRMVFQYTEVEN